MGRACAQEIESLRLALAWVAAEARKRHEQANSRQWLQRHETGKNTKQNGCCWIHDGPSQDLARELATLATRDQRQREKPGAASYGPKLRNIADGGTWAQKTKT
jgi:hypothetical protein